MQQFNQVIIIMEENDCDMRSKAFYFHFDWPRPRDVDKNLKHEIEHIIKSNECLACNKIKKQDCTITVLISAWKQCSWTQKTAK